MDYLIAGVDAAVGATCAGRGCWSAGNLLERRLERILHRAAARLRLPAEKATAVVLQSEGDTYWRTT
jgi:hypothetical protein